MIDAYDEGETFRSINRAVLILHPTQKFIDWANSTAPDIPVDHDDINDGSAAYLIPEVEEDDNEWIRKNYDMLFVPELEAWCVDEDMWPDDRSFKAFKEYFTWSIHTLVLDTCNDEIKHDEV